MIVDIDKIIVKDRIRKDYGDIQELASSIKKYGLINPPVVNKDYELLAGERRLKACKSLGWKQINVTMMDTRDNEHELEIEISENEDRKDFSRVEREAMYTRKVEIKLQKDGTNLSRKEAEIEAASEIGTSRSNMRAEQKIIQNRDLLDPTDFADWDEGKISTNKAYQRLKARLEEAKKEIDRLECRKPEIEVREVVPEDYKQLQKDLNDAKRQASAYKQDYQREQKRFNEKASENLKLRDEVEELKRQTVREQNNVDLSGSAITFAMECRVFLQNMGGYTFVAEHLMELNDRDREGYIVAAKAMRDWASILLDTIERNSDGLYGSYTSE